MSNAGRLAALVVGVLAGGAVFAIPAPRRPILRLSTIARQSAADTLVTDGAWTNPAGVADSLTANLVNLSGGGMLHKVLPATAIAVQFRQPIPLHDATYTIVLQVCRWRGTGNNSSGCAESSRSYVYGLPAPASVLGLTVVNSRIP